MTIIADLFDLVIEQITVTTEVIITASAASLTDSCPCCGVISRRVHSHYQRTLRDLPASGRPVHLILQVRRFFCQEKSCGRKIFAERFPSLTLRSNSRCTYKRLFESLASCSVVRQGPA